MDRVDVWLSHDVSVRAQATIEKRGLTLSEYMQLVLTMAADDNFPADFTLHNSAVVDAIAEVMDSMYNGKPLQGGSVDDFERKLNS